MMSVIGFVFSLPQPNCEVHTTPYLILAWALFLGVNLTLHLFTSLPLGDNPIAVNKYIIIISSYLALRYRLNSFN
jgi:hypothetical protein